MKKKILAFILFIVFVVSACSLPAPVMEWAAMPSEQPTVDPLNNPLTQAATQTAHSQETTLQPPAPPAPPAARISAGEWALFQGDYDQAQIEFENALNDQDPETQAAAIVGLGRVAYLKNNYPSAIQYLNSVIDRYPQTAAAASAYFFLGKCYEALQDPSTAAEAYRMYLTIKPGVLDVFMLEKLGDTYYAAGNYQQALTSYQAAIEATSYGGSDTQKLKTAKCYLALEDYENAINQLWGLYNTTQNDYTKAQLNYLLGEAYFQLDKPDEAYARFQDSVQNFPQAYDTYLALVTLVDDNQPVDELQRGIVDYYAGKYGLAIDAFNRYLNSTPQHNDTAHYFKGLSLRALQDYEAAIAEWYIQIQDHPGDSYYIDAYEDIAYTRWAYQQEYNLAAQVLLDFVNQNPSHPQSPSLLYQAARILERDEQLIAAAETWERLGDNYPAYEDFHRSLMLAGICRYRAKDYEGALAVFQRLSALAALPEDRAAAYLWIGKTYQALDQPEQARQAWQTAAQSDPTGYYSERAFELLDGKSPFSIDEPYDININLAEEKKLAEAWMRLTFNIPPETNISSLDILSQDARVQRGDAYWQLGLYTESHLEYESLRLEVANDPVNTFRLIDRLLTLGFYRSAILASRQILTLANLDNAATLTAPSYFNHIRFGIYHQNLFIPIAEEKGLHPLLIASLIRQESMFVGFATSSAGALGIMQLMPATAQEVVTNSGWPPNYTISDLYRPYVNIPIGIRYLARQRDYFEGNLWVSLAAYNAGPGNAMQWYQLSGGDADLFVEIIRFDETRRYLMQINEFYHIYWKLYGKTP